MALMGEHDDARQERPITTIEQAVCTGVRNLRACTQGFPTPYPAVGGTGGLHGSGADGSDMHACVCVCVLLCFVDPILGNLTVPGSFLKSGDLG